MNNWTPEQVEQLNRIQRGELDGGCTCRDAPGKGSQQDLQGHPRICPNRSITPHHDNGRDIGCLLATKDGWLCPDCGYTEGVLFDPSPEPLSATDRFALGA
ncbi:MAG: hypothetical protein ACYCQL_00615 [Acidithiobacillus sp.]